MKPPAKGMETDLMERPAVTFEETPEDFAQRQPW